LKLIIQATQTIPLFCGGEYITFYCKYKSLIFNAVKVDTFICSTVTE